MNGSEYRVPHNLKYTDTHEWILIIDNEVGIIGITDYAQRMLHDIVYVNLPKEGKSIKKGEVFMEIESVKSVAEVYAPVSGEIIAVNKLLENNPELINESPYDDGWLVKVKLSNPSELGSLLNANEYLSLIKGE